MSLEDKGTGSGWRESELLRSLMPRVVETEGSNVLVGAGDDCAVVTGQDGLLLLKADSLVEEIHFRKGEEWSRVGHKAVARVMSDIAAMGGKPRELLVSLFLSSEMSPSDVDQLYDGILALCEKEKTSLVGGDITRTHGSMSISISATGVVEESMLTLRKGGKAGDAIFCSGLLGGAVQSGHHLDFYPRIELGQWLGSCGLVNCMMDISDGLAVDVQKLAKASNCAASLYVDRLPLRNGFTSEEALWEGEDYELLFSTSQPQEFERAFSAQFEGVQLHHIGELLPADDGFSPKEAFRNGWDHQGKLNLKV